MSCSISIKVCFRLWIVVHMHACTSVVLVFKRRRECTYFIVPTPDHIQFIGGYRASVDALVQGSRLTTTLTFNTLQRHRISLCLLVLVVLRHFLSERLNMLGCKRFESTSTFMFSLWMFVCVAQVKTGLHPYTCVATCLCTCRALLGRKQVIRVVRWWFTVQ